MEVDSIWNQLFHKVYHCEDAGLFPNWFVLVFSCPIRRECF
ncbi:MAG: hypothetical protein ABIF18_03085 [archaeon]